MQHFLTSQSLRVLLLRGAAGSLFLRMFAAGSLFLISVLLARVLGVTGYGIYDYVDAWVEIFMVFATLGFDRLLIRLIATYRQAEAWGLLRGVLRFARLTTLLTGTLMLVCLAALSLLIANLTAQPLTFPFVYQISHLKPVETSSVILYAFWIGLPLLLVRALIRLQQGAMQGFQQIVLGQAAEFLLRPFLFILLITLLFVVLTATPSPVLALGLHLIAAVVALAWSAWILWKMVRTTVPPHLNEYRPRPWLSSALPLVLVTGMTLINGRLSVIIVGSLVNYEAVGLFSAATRLSEFIALLSISTNAALGPQITRLYEAGEHERLQHTLTRMTRVVFSISLLLLLVLALFGDGILRLFGAVFTAAQPALIIMSVGQVLNIASGPVALLLIMTGHERDAAIGVIVATMINLLLNVLLVGSYGINGAALATAVGTVIWNMLMIVFVWQRLRLHATILGQVYSR